jgi:hypothetical protein
VVVVACFRTCPSAFLTSLGGLSATYDYTHRESRTKNQRNAFNMLNQTCMWATMRHPKLALRRARSYMY